MTNKVISIQSKLSVEEAHKHIDNLDWKTWYITKTGKQLLKLLVDTQEEWVKHWDIFKVLDEAKVDACTPRLEQLGFIETGYWNEIWCGDEQIPGDTPHLWELMYVPDFNFEIRPVRAYKLLTLTPPPPKKHD